MANEITIPKSFIDEVQSSWQLKRTSPHTKEQIIKIWNELSDEKKYLYREYAIQRNN